ncbi:MAG: hypothetical protein OXC13_15765 [Caldilineaceae bacterium]|nr:hypothetical protein [Caldilineaceae bacterium]
MSAPRVAVPIDERPTVGTPEPALTATLFQWGDAQPHLGDSLELAASWPVPIVIVSDSLGSFPSNPS